MQQIAARFAMEINQLTMLYAVLCVWACVNIIWAFRLVRYALRKLNIKRNYALNALIIGFIFSLGYFWDTLEGFAILLLLVGTSMSFIYLRPVLILGKDEFHVDRLEAFEVFLCLSIYGLFALSFFVATV